MAGAFAFFEIFGAKEQGRFKKWEDIICSSDEIFIHL